MRSSDEFAVSVAKRIRELREARGLSLRELARRSGLPPESVSRSERGITEITLSSLAKVCAGLDVQLPDFFSFSGETEGRLPSRLRPAIEVLGGLSPERFSRVVEALRLLLEEPRRGAGAKPRLKRGRRRTVEPER
jgi:transcriptional regulator with XRE-family HTH domain